MLEKIRKVEQVFRQLDKETKQFARKSKIKCLTNCNLCCLKKGLEANVLEFLPLAYYLVKNNLHEEVLNRLETEPEYCINLASNQIPGKTSGCSHYKYRGLICRLFGSSAAHDKNSKLSIYTCSHIKTTQKEAYLSANEKINAGLIAIPQVSDFYYQIYFIDPNLANDYNPINISIRKAIERVAYFYEHQPVRKRQKKLNQGIDAE